MQFLERIFKRQATARLIDHKAIVDCIDLLAGAHENWSDVSREAAAGMVLVMLAKNARLGDYVNDTGWELVLTFIGDHPEIVDYVSPRAMTDIGARQLTRHDGLLARAA